MPDEAIRTVGFLGAGATNLVAISEAFKLASVSGLDLDAIPEALAGGFADSIPLQIFGPRMARGVFMPVLGELALMLKDLSAAADLAREHGSVLPMTLAALDIYRRAAGSGLIQQDSPRCTSCTGKPPREPAATHRGEHQHVVSGSVPDPAIRGGAQSGLRRSRNSSSLFGGARRTGKGRADGCDARGAHQRSIRRIETSLRHSGPSGPREPVRSQLMQAAEYAEAVGAKFVHVLAGLAGWLGAEYSPSGATDDSLSWLVDWRATLRS